MINLRRRRSISLRTPLERGAPWNFQTQYGIVNWSVSAIWFLRLASPAAWILSLFQVQDNTGRYHAAARPTELYVLLTHGCCTLLFLALAPRPWISSWVVTAAVILLIVEVCQYHFYLMILRPSIDRAYAQYNFSRTLILTLVSYQGLITLFSILYLGRLESQFSVTKLSRASAWFLSAGILTGTGYSGITPKPGSVAAVIGGAESIVGILFLTAILGLALSRVSARAIDAAVTRSPRLIDPQEIRRALKAAGQSEVIDRIQTALQADVWVTGGWLRSYALGQHDYNGDVDLLVDGLSHEALARRLESNGIRFSRSRLGGFRFEPAPGIKIDCFSTSAFGQAVSVQESFGYFNATVNAAAFKFSDPDTFFVHPLF